MLQNTVDSRRIVRSRAIQIWSMSSAILNGEVKYPRFLCRRKHYVILGGNDMTLGLVRQILAKEDYILPYIIMNENDSVDVDFIVSTNQYDFQYVNIGGVILVPNKENSMVLTKDNIISICNDMKNNGI
mgnify:CR=1 FL=1